MRNMLRMAAAVALAAAAGHADDVTLKSGIPFSDVTIIQVKNSFVTYRISGGGSVTKSLLDIKKIKLRQASSFNKAEELMAAKTPDAAAAVKAYDAAGVDGAGEWFKPLVRYRRLRALAQARLIDRAVAEWLAVMDADGASPAAISLQPKQADKKGSPRNAKGIKLLETRLKSVAEKKEYAGAIRQTLMRLYRAEGDTAKADRLANLLAGGSAEPKPATRAGTGAPPAVAASDLDKQLGADRVLIRPGQTPKNLENALRRIRSNLGQYDESQLPTALLAGGRARVLLAAGLAGAEQRTMLLAAGLDLMRVVAHFNGSPEAPEALLAAAEVNGRLGNVRAARNAYQEVLKRFADRPEIAQKAKAALESLGQK